ncbi:MAG: dephospho-CoA kinase [Planctomycetota bacterium]|nr:dephospho-CoA kinase [Planctomycetota bacterium]
MLGGIGAGKSYVARRLAALTGGTLVDADALAHQALDACAADGRLTEALGPGYVTAEGGANREALAQEVFSDPALLGRLEDLVHPLVFALMDDLIQNHGRGDGPAVLVLDVPLLIEVGLDPRCDVLWFVDVPEALRKERTGRRGLSWEETKLREQSQTPLEEKRERADWIIRNDVEDALLDQQIREALDAVGVRTPTGS